MVSRGGRAWGGALPRIVAVGALMASCAEREPGPRAEAAPRCDPAGAREVVERLGGRMRSVSLLAPDSVVVREIREAYAPLVTPDLLDAWTTDPARAPGRTVSSPWPERIEVRSVEAAGDGACQVAGEVVYVTSVEVAQGGAVDRVPVTLRVVDDGGWRVGAYEADVSRTISPPTPPSPDSISSPSGAADVLRRYYAAIEARDFRRAYELWGDDGEASGQTFEEFAAGFAETARVEVEIGEAGRVEGAAGSRYVVISVVIRTETMSGEAQRFEGTYTLRRSVVDGASQAQRRWHLYSAEIVRSR